MRLIDFDLFPPQIDRDLAFFYFSAKALLNAVTQSGA